MMSPVEQYTIDCEYLAYFPTKFSKKFIKEILCTFLVQTLQYFENIFLFAHENMKKNALKSCS